MAGTDGTGLPSRGPGDSSSRRRGGRARLGVPRTCRPPRAGSSTRPAAPGRALRGEGTRDITEKPKARRPTHAAANQDPTWLAGPRRPGSMTLTGRALGELAVAARGPGHPGRATFTSVGAGQVDTAAWTAGGRILALVHVCGQPRGDETVAVTAGPLRRHPLAPPQPQPRRQPGQRTHLLGAQTLALRGAVLGRGRAGAAVAAPRVLTHSVAAVGLVQALVHVCGRERPEWRGGPGAGRPPAAWPGRPPRSPTHSSKFPS